MTTISGIQESSAMHLYQDVAPTLQFYSCFVSSVVHGVPSLMPFYLIPKKKKAAYTHKAIRGRKSPHFTLPFNKIFISPFPHNQIKPQHGKAFPTNQITESTASTPNREIQQRPKHRGQQRSWHRQVNPKPTQLPCERHRPANPSSKQLQIVQDEQQR